MLTILGAIIWTLLAALKIMFYCLIGYLVLHWLMYFGIVNSRHNIVSAIYDTLSRLFEPIFHQIRRYVKPFNGVDLSAVVLFLLIFFCQVILIGLSAKLVFSAFSL